jgi:hypothetical protein
MGFPRASVESQFSRRRWPDFVRPSRESALSALSSGFRDATCRQRVQRPIESGLAKEAGSTGASTDPLIFSTRVKKVNQRYVDHQWRVQQLTSKSPVAATTVQVQQTLRQHRAQVQRQVHQQASPRGDADSGKKFSVENADPKQLDRRCSERAAMSLRHKDRLENEIAASIAWYRADSFLDHDHRLILSRIAFQSAV